MAARLGILIIHGMGTAEEEFHLPFKQLIENRMRDQDPGFDESELAWRQIWWSPVTAGKQENLLKSYKKSALNWSKTREFFVRNFGDAVAYHRGGNGLSPRQKNVKDEVHGVIRKAMLALEDDIGSDAPVVLLAYSLGCYMVSDYIWDRQKEHEHSPDPALNFRRFQTLAGIATYGCNIPYFTLALHEIQAIAFPPPDLPEKYRAVAKWMNYYDREDVLGYPMKPLSKSYARSVTEDVEINVGNIIEFWNPLSHGAYQKDADLARPVADQILDVLKVARQD